MNPYPNAFFELDADEKAIRALQFTTSPANAGKNLWISPVGHKGTLKIHSKLHPLLINYIADDRGSLIIRLDDPLLHSVLTEIETKVTAAAPKPGDVDPLVKRDASGRYPDSFKIKVAYTQWVCANTGEKMSAEEALSSKRNRITSWVLDVYKLNLFRTRAYFGVCLRSAKVSRAMDTSDESNKRKREEEDDYTQYL